MRQKSLLLHTGESFLKPYSLDNYAEYHILVYISIPLHVTFSRNEYDLQLFPGFCYTQLLLSSYVPLFGDHLSRNSIGSSHTRIVAYMREIQR